MSERPFERDLDEVFRLVANDTRIAILRALWDAHTEDPESVDGPQGDPVSFSSLRARADVADSGRFNYHLDELVPRLVERRADGYVLTDAGGRIVGAAVAGVYRGGDVELDASTMGPCPEPDCDGTLRATYENGHVSVACDGCSRRTVLHAPPIVLETHDGASQSEALRRYTTAEVQQVSRGFCSLCHGPSRARVGPSHLDPDPDPDPDSDSAASGPVKVVHECVACGNVAHTTATVCLLDHPAVVSFLHDAGVDYRRIALWRPPAGIDREEAVESVDPVRVVVDLVADDEALRVRLDDALDVVDYDRRAAADG